MTSFLLKAIFLYGRNDTPQTLEHVLCYWKTALCNGRYIWKHIRVLGELVRFIKNYMNFEPTILTQKFVSETRKIYAGSKQTIKHQVITLQNFLETSGNWDVSAYPSG